MTRNIWILLILLSVIAQVSFAQVTGQPRQVKAKGTYIHTRTKTEFPEQIGIYKRQSVYSFDKKKENIGVTYQNQTTDGKIAISVYLYPAGSGTEGRLRNEYLQAMQDMANAGRNGIDADQGYKCYKKDGYKVNGFSATTDKNPLSQLTLFECGKWFFKIRITTDYLDTMGINKAEKEILDHFTPTMLVKNDPLDSKAETYIAPGAFKDSVLLGSVMGSAFKKLEWSLKHIDSLERASGFPDLYLEMHTESLKEFVKFEKRKTFRIIQPYTRQYLDQLNLIIDSGFLEEFILDQYSSVMIFSGLKLDIDLYNKWKADHPISINLNQRFYILSYGTEK